MRFWQLEVWSAADLQLLAVFVVICGFLIGRSIRG